MPVITGDAVYPENALAQLKEKCASCVAFDALALAEKVGEARAVNLVLLGALSNHMDANEEAWLGAIADCVPEKIRNVNLAAFREGRAVKA